MADTPRAVVRWGAKELPAPEAGGSSYRICGAACSGKSHLTKLFLLNVLRELETNPHAKLIAYDPKRELYTWLCSLGLTSSVTYFCPSDVRSVALGILWLGGSPK